MNDLTMHNLSLNGLHNGLQHITQVKPVQDAPTDAGDIDKQLNGYDAQWLMAQDLPETEFIVQSILPVGYTVLGGRPKMGKSISVLGSIAMPVATGEQAFSNYDVRQGTVLGLFYEDTKRRLKDRLTRFTHFSTTMPNLSKLRAYHDFPRAHAGGIETIQALLDKYPDTKLVIIDTLPRFSPPRERGQDAYDSEYNLGALLFKLAHERQIAIMGIVHTTKSSYSNVFDNLRGSGGTAAADVLMVLERTNDKTIRILHTVGRDTEETRLELYADNETLKYTMVGECDDERYAELTNFDFKASIPEKDAKKAQAQELKASGKSVREIASELRVSKSSVGQWLKDT
jgi:RecA-family ATPase